MLNSNDFIFRSGAACPIRMAFSRVNTKKIPMASTPAAIGEHVREETVRNKRENRQHNGQMLTQAESQSMATPQLVRQQHLRAVK